MNSFISHIAMENLSAMKPHSTHRAMVNIPAMEAQVPQLTYSLCQAPRSSINAIKKALLCLKKIN